MVWLSYYEEYPIYEPAEGGYWYAGLELVGTERLSKRAAKRKFDKMAKDHLQDGDWWLTKSDGRCLIKDSEYIGEGSMIIIERSKGSRRKGYEPYC